MTARQRRNSNYSPTKLANLIVFPFQLRRFEDCSGNGHWPQWFSFRLENLGAALVTWAAVWCELWTNMWTWDLSASTACYFLICCPQRDWAGASLWHVAWCKVILYPGSTESEKKASIQWKPVTGSCNSSRPLEKSYLFWWNSIRPDIC